jgi:hypothetical protein
MKYGFIILLLILISSCTRHHGDFIAPPAKAAVVLSSPLSEQVYSKTDSVAIAGTAIASETIHGYELVIRRVGDASVVYSKQIHDHNDTLRIQEKWKAESSYPMDLELEIRLILDHSGNVFQKKQLFSVR